MAFKGKKTMIKIKKTRENPDEFLTGGAAVRFTTPFQIIILICDLQASMPFDQMKSLDMEWEIKVYSTVLCSPVNV